MKAKSALRPREDDAKRWSLQPSNNEILQFENDYEELHDSLEVVRMRQHLQNTASRKNKTSQGTRQSLGAPAGVGLKAASNNLNPLLDSLDSPRMANQ